MPAPARDSVEVWLADHGDALFAYAVKRVRDRASAEDLVQETLLAAMNPSQPFEGRSQVRTWLFGILRHKVLDFWRARERATVSLDEELREHVDGMYSPNGHWRREHAPHAWKRHGADSAELVEILRACLEKLPPRAAEAFLLRERHGVSVEQLSQEFGTNPTNVWQILSRARAALRECVERGDQRDLDGGG